MTKKAWILSLLFAGMASVGFVPSIQKPTYAAIVSEAGKPLPSLFDGLKPSPGIWEARSAARRRNACIEGGTPIPGFIGRLASLFTPASVLAGSCTESGCGGHYFSTPASPWCSGGGGSCGPGTYNKYYSPGGDYCDGYKYTGAEECQGCVCEEAECNSCE